MKYEMRLAKLEASAPGNESLKCWLWVDATASEQDIEAHKAKRIAQLRAVNAWPDDGQHPVEVTLFAWLRPGSDA